MNLSEKSSAHIHFNKCTSRFYYTTGIKKLWSTICSIRTTIEACWWGNTAAMTHLVFIPMFTGKSSVHIVFSCSTLGGLLSANRLNQRVFVLIFVSKTSCFLDSVQAGCSVVMFLWRTICWEWFFCSSRLGAISSFVISCKLDWTLCVFSSTLEHLTWDFWTGLCYTTILHPLLSRPGTQGHPCQTFKSVSMTQ